MSYKTHPLTPFLFPARFALAAVVGCLCGSLQTAMAQDGGPFGMPVSEASGSTGVPELPIVVEAKNLLRKATSQAASGAQVITFTYDPNRTYNIPVREGSFTTLRFDHDDVVQQVAVSNKDALAAVVNESSNTVMMRLDAAVTVSATVVTTNGVYYLTVVPSFRGEPWYQGVSWSASSNDFEVYSTVGEAPDGVFGGGYQSLPNSAAGGAPNFDYTIKDHGVEFAPVSVWDNGEFTWIQFRSNLQQLPAVFVQGPNGLAVVNYTVHADGSQILVNRLMPAFVLRIGETSVTVEARR